MNHTQNKIKAKIAQAKNFRVCDWINMLISINHEFVYRVLE